MVSGTPSRFVFGPFPVSSFVADVAALDLGGLGITAVPLERVRERVVGCAGEIDAADGFYRVVFSPPFRVVSGDGSGAGSMQPTNVVVEWGSTLDGFGGVAGWRA